MGGIRMSDGLEPVEEGGWVDTVCTLGVVGLAALGGLYLLSGSTGRTAGATRSARLEIESREQQIAQVMEEQHLSQQAGHEADAAE